MNGFADWVRGVALGLGAPGLYIVAFLDSSFLSLPEITDLLVVWMVTYIVLRADGAASGRSAFMA